MPLYEYQCPQCGRFEVIQKFSDEPLRACPTCGQDVQKLLAAPAFQFKGSGWYVTDYARKGKTGSESKKDDGGKESSSSGGSDSAKSESSKSDSTPTTSTSK